MENNQIYSLNKSPTLLGKILRIHTPSEGTCQDGCIDIYEIRWSDGNIEYLDDRNFRYRSSCSCCLYEV